MNAQGMKNISKDSLTLKRLHTEWSCKRFVWKSRRRERRGLLKKPDPKHPKDTYVCLRIERMLIWSHWCYALWVVDRHRVYIVVP